MFYRFFPRESVEQNIALMLMTVILLVILSGAVSILAALMIAWLGLVPVILGGALVLPTVFTYMALFFYDRRSVVQA